MSHTMLTRQGLMKATHEELVDQRLALSNIGERIDKMMTKIDMLEASLSISKNVNSLLMERIINLEKSVINNSQYLRKECLELNAIPDTVEDNALEKTVCEALSLTGTTVQPSSLEAVHRLKRPSCVIVKFKSRKLRNEVFSKKRILMNKSKELVNLGLNDKLYINESLSKENQHLFYQCRMLKKGKKVHDTWFANGVINMIYGVNDSITKIYHSSDIERVLNIANIDEYLKSIM